MPRLRELPDPVHNVLHLCAAAMGAAMLALALIDLIDHYATLWMMVH